MRFESIATKLLIPMYLMASFTFGCAGVEKKPLPGSPPQPLTTRGRNAPAEFQNHRLQRYDAEADYYLETKSTGFFLYMVVYPKAEADNIYDPDQGALWNCMEKIKRTAGSIAGRMHREILYPDPDLDNFNFQRDFCTIEGNYDFKK